MSDFSVIGGSQKYEDCGVNTAASIGLVITANSTINTKGSWIELIASTGFDYEALILAFNIDNSPSFLVDLGIGAGGSEVVLVSNIYVAFAGSATQVTQTLEIPINIPEGTRVSMRAQSTSSSFTFDVKGTGKGNTLRQSVGLGRATTYGATTADSTGALIDAGGTPNTKGAYTEITASTTDDIKKLILCVGTSITSVAINGSLFDIAIGAAGSEVVITPESPLYAETSYDSHLPAYHTFDVDIPTGTRIAVRSQSSTSNSSSRVWRAVLIGVT